jgi:hypothetical protein
MVPASQLAFIRSVISDWALETFLISVLCAEIKLRLAEAIR